jgi:F-type H+-transporting ATPase subunit gamma
MAQDKAIKRRIRSVKNAKQITKALEVVAASRMRKVVQLVEGSRAYGDLAAKVMQKIVANPEAKNHPFFKQSPDKPTLYVIITSDRGQAGAFNSNIFNLALNSFKQDRQQPHLVIFGRKGARFFSHLSGINLRGTYENVPDNPDINVFAPTIDLIEQEVMAGNISKVVIIYTQFVSSLVQKTTSFQFLPIDISSAESDQADESKNRVYEFEPDTTDVLDEAIHLYSAAKLMQARIESAASEHAMRMVAMGNANRNASDLIDDLTLELNASRQAAITQEIAEITGGAAAVAA